MGTSRPTRWLDGFEVLQLDEHLATSYAGSLLRRLGARVWVAHRDRTAFEPGDALYALLNGPTLDAAGAERFDVAVGGPTVRTWAPPENMPFVEGVFDPGDGATPDASELIAEATSGWLRINGDPGRDGAPVRAAGHQIMLQSGVVIAMLALAALRDHRRTGRVRHFSLGIRELAITLQNCTAKTSYSGLDVFGRGISETQPSQISSCADGSLFISAVEDGQWRALCEIVGRPDLPDTPEFATRQGRWAHHETLNILLADAVATKSRMEVAERSAERGVPTVPVLDAADLLELPQLEARQAWEGSEIEGAPVRVPALPFTFETGSPAGPHVARDLGKWNPAGPLDDIFITETSWVWAAPFCSELLAWLGANVVKIESGTHVDFFRRSQAFPGSGLDLNASPSFNQLNMGKRSIVLDLSRPDHIDLLWKLVRQSDIFLSNFRPGVLERLGVTPERLREVPGLVATRISGFGDVGPWANRVLYGAAAVMIGGIGAYTGYPETKPTLMGFAFGDPCSANYTALALLAALCHRDAAGAGALIETSITETILNQSLDLMLAHQLDGAVPRLGNGHPRHAPQGIHATGDGSLLVIAVETDLQWQTLSRVIGAGGELARLDRPSRCERREELDEIIGDWAAGLASSATGVEILAAERVPCATALSPGSALTDRALLASGYIAPQEHPSLGVKLMAGAPWTMDGARPLVRRAPLLGEHTAEIRRAVSPSSVDA